MPNARAATACLSSRGEADPLIVRHVACWAMVRQRMRFLVTMLIASALLTGCRRPARNEGKTAATPIQIDVGAIFRAPLAGFRRDLGRFPTTEEGLMVLLYPPRGAANAWKGPYVEGTEVPVDPWGHRYLYRFPAIKDGPDEYDVWSLGPDGLPSEDDIGNWTK
jgi:general secretion pathway protein G